MDHFAGLAKLSGYDQQRPNLEAAETGDGAKLATFTLLAWRTGNGGK
jgi:hypothetical protein